MKFKVTKWKALGLALTVFSLTHCKKDQQFNTEESLLETRIGAGFNNANISFDAREISFKNYKNGVDNSPEKQLKLLASYEKVNTYSYQLNANRQGYQLTIDKLESQSPVDDWNKTEGKPYRITSDGVSLSSFDRNGKLIFRGPADKSGVGATKVLQDLTKSIDKRPIELKMQESISLGAKVKKQGNYYYVMVQRENPNYNHNGVYIYSVRTGSIICSTIYDDFDLQKTESVRFIRYNAENNPIEIYTEQYEYLPDGDIETSVTILKLSNTTVNIQ